MRRRKSEGESERGIDGVGGEAWRRRREGGGGLSWTLSRGRWAERDSSRKKEEVPPRAALCTNVGRRDRNIVEEEAATRSGAIAYRVSVAREPAAPG